MAINDPYVPGDPYSYDLKWIVKQLKTLRPVAPAPEVIEIIADSGDNTAQIITEHTWDELIELIEADRILFWIHVTSELDTVKNKLIYPVKNEIAGVVSIQIDDCRLAFSEYPISKLYLRKAHFVGSLTGYYQEAQISV